jgi:DNA-binding HxlR family transcriptional regulator
VTESYDRETELTGDDAKAIDFGLSVLSPRWTVEILIDLAEGPRRTTQLLKDLKGVSAKTLCQRLRKLGELNLITRTTYPEVPPRVEYSLTPKGRNLYIILESLRVLGGELQAELTQKRNLIKGNLAGIAEKKPVECLTELAPEELVAQVAASKDSIAVA